MTRTSDNAPERTSDEAAPATGPKREEPSQQTALATRRVFVVDADTALIGLLDEWLAGEDCVVVDERTDGGAAKERYDLVIVDVPFPREGGADLLRRIARDHPATPVLALSSAFFGGIGCRGPIARALGVTCVLPKPASREALTRVVRELLSR